LKLLFLTVFVFDTSAVLTLYDGAVLKILLFILNPCYIYFSNSNISGGILSLGDYDSFESSIESLI
jgi:hypothetical protein